MIGNTCNFHPNERRRKFCKDSGCYERLCPICVKERHTGHSVVDYKIILEEMKAERDKNNINKGKFITEFKKTISHLESLKRNIKKNMYLVVCVKNVSLGRS